jgi:hypothetical protein
MTETEAKASADRLIEMLLHQKELVGRLDKLALGQMELIDAGESDALLDLLGDRQRIVDELTASQDSVVGLSRSLHGRDDIGTGIRDRITELVDDISDQLLRVVNRDEQDRARLRTARERAADGLTQVRTAKRARQAYVNDQTRNNRFADRRG